MKRQAYCTRVLTTAGIGVPAAIGAVFSKVLLVTGLLCCVSCYKNIGSDDIDPIDNRGTEKIAFKSSELDQQDFPAKASSALESDFMVSTYKMFGRAEQLKIMDNYKVEYLTSGNAWSGSVRHYWDYTTVEGQQQKYWDLSGFPYRFHAVAPYPTDLSEMTFNEKELRINRPYYFQTCIDGLVQTRNAGLDVTHSPAEPFMAAQVERGTDHRDKDLLSHREGATDFNNGSTSYNRTVWMPFHHFNSKVRFAVYSIHPWVSANHIYIKELTVKVVSDAFVTTAEGYRADCTAEGNWRPDTGHAGFVGLTRIDAGGMSGLTLLRFDGGADIRGNDLFEAQSRKTAFFLQCEDGLMQLPQKSVQMTVSFTLCTQDGNIYKQFRDVPIRYDLDGVDHPKHDWESGYQYTYFFVVGGIEEKLEIEFSCTLEPWEEVGGRLSTDLEQ